MEIRDMKIGLAHESFFSWFTHLSDDLEVVRNNTHYDLIIFTGGADINPAIYGQDAHPSTHFLQERDDSEMSVFNTILIDEGSVRNIITDRVLGVCRGHQLLNAGFGGTLYQDLYSIGKEHEGTHKIKWKDDVGYDISPIKKFTCINSMHHQAIKLLADGAIELGYEPMTGINECVDFNQTIPCFGTQFHPEAFERTTSINFFNALLEVMENKEK